MVKVRVDLRSGSVVRTEFLLNGEAGAEAAEGDGPDVRMVVSAAAAAGHPT